jgi:methyl-accepting chemotaxis protein
MNSVSVKAALASLFMLMIGMIGLLGYLAITRISHINQNVDAFAINYLPSTDALGRIGSSLGSFRYLEAEHVFSTDAEAPKAVELELGSQQKSIEQGMAEYSELAGTAEEKQAYSTLMAMWETYRKSHAQLLERSQGKDRPSAEALYLGEMKKLFLDLDRRVDQAIEIEREEARAEKAQSVIEYTSTLWLMFLLVGVSLVVAFGAMVFSFLGVSRPIERITQSMSALARGDVSIVIPFSDRRNEIGAMAGAVQVFKDNMIRGHELEAEAEAAKVKSEAERRRTMQGLAEQFERAVGGIVETVSNAATELQTAAQALSTSSSQTTHQSTIVATSSEEAAGNVRTVAAAAEELSGSIREISRQVSESANMSNKAVQEAQETNAQVTSLSGGAQKIGAIVDLINDIASKTNLLALNATIEAARAGEAGRGFAVVASEVKALAEQTSKATAEITSHISAVQTSTDQAANAILGIGRTINEINHIASAIAASVEEQGLATEEIARSVEQVAASTTEVTHNITGVSEAAEASSSSASQVLSSATELATQSEKLRGEMHKFLSTVRAA